MFKKIIIVLVVLISIPLLVALFVKNEYVVERDIIIERPVTEVFSYLKFLKNQDNFSKWASMDPDMKKSSRGIDGTVGYVSAWESDDENVGTGEQEITGIKENERIDYEIRFKEPFSSVSPAYILTRENPNSSTRVTWGFSGKMDYPTNLMFLFMDFEEMIGEDLETGLGNLKNELEGGNL